MPDQNIEILRRETYIKAIENSIGTRLFNSLFVRYKDTGVIKDILNDGEYSCAFFVSGLLSLTQMISKTSSTVDTLKKDIESDESWKKVEQEDIQPGDIVFYKKMKFEDGSENAHVGFVLNSNEAVSTDYKNKCVARHSITGREIDCFYQYQ